MPPFQARIVFDTLQRAGSVSLWVIAFSCKRREPFLLHVLHGLLFHGELAHRKLDFCQVLSAFCKVLSALLSFAAKKELIALGISQIWTQKTTGSIYQLFMCFCMPELVWIDFHCIREIWGVNDTCLPLKTLFKNNNNTIISMTFIALPWGN